MLYKQLATSDLNQEVFNPKNLKYYQCDQTFDASFQDLTSFKYSVLGLI